MIDTFKFNPNNHTYELDGRPLTGITTILSVIAKPSLISWASRMACEYVRENLTSLEELEEVLAQAVNAHIRKKEIGAEKGTDFHAWVERWIADQTISLPEEEEPRTQAEQFVQWVAESKVEFLASEKRMYSRIYWIAGTADFICEIEGKKYVGDLKSYGKIWDRVPFLQVAGYRLMAEEMGENGFAGGIVVNVPKKGILEVAYSFDMGGDTEGFLSALRLYRVLQSYQPK